MNSRIPPNSLLGIMNRLGFCLDELLPVFPGHDKDYVQQLQVDCANALNRPYIGYGLLGVEPCRTRYFNIKAPGFRLNGTDQPWPPPSGRPVVFVFGGSTTMGYYIEDKDTVPSRLGVHLGRHGIEVYNFGAGSYTSRQEALWFLMVLEEHGIRPDIALFLDGYNDAFYAFGNPALTILLDRLYRDERKRRNMPYLAAQLDYARRSRRLRRESLPSVGTYQVCGGSAAIAQLLSRDGVVSELKNAEEWPVGTRPAPHETIIAERVWTYYKRSMAMIRAVAEQFDVETHFVWQPVPFFATRPGQRVMDAMYPHFAAGAFCGPLYRWLAANRFPGLTNDIAFLDLSRLGGDVDQVLYLDICHYSPAFAERIAAELARHLMSSSNRLRILAT